MKIGDNICHHEGEFLGPILDFKVEPVKSTDPDRRGRVMLMVVVEEGKYYAGDVAYAPTLEEIKIRAAECREKHFLRRLHETGEKYG